MKATRGQADAARVRELILEKLGVRGLSPAVSRARVRHRIRCLTRARGPALRSGSRGRTRRDLWPPGPLGDVMASGALFD